MLGSVDFLFPSPYLIYHECDSSEVGGSERMVGFVVDVYAEEERVGETAGAHDLWWRNDSRDEKGYGAIVIVECGEAVYTWSTRSSEFKVQHVGKSFVFMPVRKLVVVANKQRLDDLYLWKDVRNHRTAEIL